MQSDGPLLPPTDSSSVNRLLLFLLRGLEIGVEAHYNTLDFFPANLFRLHWSEMAVHYWSLVLVVPHQKKNEKHRYGWWPSSVREHRDNNHCAPWH